MARVNSRSSIVPDLLNDSRIHQNSRTDRSSHSSDLSSGSDKENSNRRTSSGLGKRKATSRAMSTPAQQQSAASNKRRRLEERGKGPAGQSARRRELSQQVDGAFYDPDQNEATKRKTVKDYRDLHALLKDSRPQFLQRGSRGIQNTLKEADNLIKDVKQTSTATIDSLLLVNIGDLAYKKVTTMTLGDSSTAIDVDDFLSKCILYMKSAPETSTHQSYSSTQRRYQQRHARNGNEDSAHSEDEDEDNTDLNWAHLGRTLCFPAINRPCLSSFLLGPLSVQKKVRQPTQRRAAQPTQNSITTTRPIELDQSALDKQESASLTSICSEIASLLRRTQRRGEQLVEKEVEALEAQNIEPSDQDIQQIMRRHNIASNGGVPLFHFCVNPRSFGQTVENFFYVSFLIKEGRVGLDYDENELPTLSMVETKSVRERQETQRNQAVFTLDFDVWEELVQSFGIQKSVVPHRERQAWEEDDGVIRHGPPRSARDTTEPASSGGTDPGLPPGVPIGTTFEEDEDMYGPG